MTEPLPSQLPAILGFSPKDAALFRVALTHKSFSNEHRNQHHNERLEFLGDAVLELAISNALFQQFPSAQEGELTRIRGAMVNTATLATAAKHMGLMDLVRLSRGEQAAGGADKERVLANVFEAVLGAVFVEGGLPAATDFVERHLLPELPARLKNLRQGDPKSFLQEKIQEGGHPAPTYRVTHDEGPAHARVFTAQVFCRQHPLGTGTGTSKKKAQIAAAADAVAHFEERFVCSDEQ